MNTTEFKKLRNVVRQQIIGMAIHDSRWYDVISAADFAEQYHTGTRKDGITPEIYHQYSMAGYALTLVTLFQDIAIEVLVTIFLHDTIEDYPETIELVYKNFNKYSDYVNDMSKEKVTGKLENSDYYRVLASNPVLAIVKGIDRTHNLSTVKALGEKKIKEYVTETEFYVLPMLKKAKQTSPQHTMIFENLKSVLNIICNAYKQG